jgi:hypothetical protein
MADTTVKMVAGPGYGEGQQKVSWEYEETLSAVAVGKKVLIPHGVNNIAVTISFTGSALGKISTTTEKIDVVKAGTADIWIDWPTGATGTNATASLDPCTAIRVECTNAGTAGTVKFTVRAQ